MRYNSRRGLVRHSALRRFRSRHARPLEVDENLFSSNHDLRRVAVGQPDVKIFPHEVGEEQESKGGTLASAPGTLNMMESMDASPTRNVATENARIDPALSSTKTSNSRVIGNRGLARDLGREVSYSNHERQARNSEHQMSARRLAEGNSVHSDSDAGAYIASPERHIRRRLSSTVAAGFGTNYAGESSRSWTRAG